MSMYLYILLALALFSLFPKSKVLFFVSFLILLSVGGLRDFSVGTDTLNYYELYQYGNNTSFMKGIEWGYTLVQQFVYFYLGDYAYLVFLQMFLILCFFYIFILRESENFSFSVFCFVCLYYWLYSLNITRQYIAMPLVLIGFSYLLRGNTRTFIALVFCAMLFHTSAIFSLAVLFFYKQESFVSRLLKKEVLILSFLIGITPLIPSMMKVFISVFDALGLPGFSSYLSEDSGFRDGGFSVSRFLLTMYGILLLITLDNKEFYVRVFAFGIILLNLFAFQPSIGRLAQYFVCIQIILIPNLSLYVLNERNVIPLRVISLVYMVVTFFYLLSANIGEVVPYKWGTLVS